MRVIAGSRKGRRLLGPAGAALRPTSGRVKEALFSILGPRVLGARVLDLYAGTGAIGIEALSRGASWVTFVEPHSASLRVLRANLSRCGFLSFADVQPCSAAAFLQRRPTPEHLYSVVFADPPYGFTGNHTLLLLSELDAIIGYEAVVILEHSTKSVIPSAVGRFMRLRQYRYGDTTLSVFGVQVEGASSP